MNAWKIALLSALGLTGLWLLSPSRSQLASQPGVVEISYMAPGGPISNAMDDAVREFERRSVEAHAKDPAKPIYRVISGQNASRDPTEDPTRFLVSLAGGMPPDVVAFDRFAVSEWAARGAFTPLDAYMAKDKAAGRADGVKQEDFYSTAWQEAIYTDPRSGEGHVYGVPFNFDSRALYYNKDLLKRAGYNAPPETWEQLQEMAVRLTEKDEKGRVLRLGFVPNFGNTFLYLYGWMNGGEFMSADMRHVTLNDPKIVGALDWMTKLYDDLGGAKQVYAFQSTFQGGDLDPFIIGKVAMKIDGVWMLDAMTQFGGQMNWAIAPPPVPASERARGVKTSSWVGGWCYAVPSSAKQKDAAWELIRFLNTKEAIQIMSESERLTYLSQGRTYVPRQHPNIAINEWLAKHYVYDDPNADPKLKQGLKVFNDLLPVARFRPVSMVGMMLWNQQITAMEDAIFHKATAQEALDQGTALVQHQLDLGLAPPRGIQLKWSWFLWPYALLVVVLAVGIYYWDTRLELRRSVVKSLGPWGEKLLELSGGVEGGKSSFMRSQWRDGWIMASPWLIGFILFTGGPILFSVIISFTDYDIINPPHWVGLANFEWLFFKDPLFWKSFWNTCYMFLGIPLGMAVSLGMALLLNMEVKGVAVWRTFFYVPSIIPAVASAILWIWILNPSSGLLNTILASVGLNGPNWLQDESTSKLSLILMGLWAAGGGIIIWLAGLKGISESYYEAASIDGADTMQKFRHVTIPMLTPYIFFNLIMGIIATFQIFTPSFIMTKGGPVNSTLFYVYHLFNNAFRFLRMGYAAAAAWFLFVIVFSLTMVQMRSSKRWVHYEGD
jgi:multiple sugar transport system permease protein